MIRGPIGSEVKLTLNHAGRTVVKTLKRQSMRVLLQEDLGEEPVSDLMELPIRVTQLGYKLDEIGAILQNGRPLAKWSGALPEKAELKVVLFSAERSLDHVAPPVGGYEKGMYRFFHSGGESLHVEWTDLRGRVLHKESLDLSGPGWQEVQLKRPEFKNQGVIANIRVGGKLLWSGTLDYSGESK